MSSNSHNKLYYPVYYINLDRSTDRKEYMENQMKQYNISFNRISAIDKLNITNNILGKVDRFGYINKCLNINEQLCSGQLGCIMSHFKTYYEALQKEEEIIIVFEDDISLDYMDNWSLSIKDIVESAPIGWNTIQLHTLNPLIITGLNKLDEKLYEKPHDAFGSDVYMYYGTGAYCISKNGMQALINKFCRNNTIILEGKYNVADGLLYSLPQSYIYTKPLFYTNEQFISNIYDVQNKIGDISTKIIKHILNN